MAQPHPNKKGKIFVDGKWVDPPKDVETQNPKLYHLYGDMHGPEVQNKKHIK